eukprot:CAMPEP_0205933582 /NCGR_PEP_ID=MMETSP1325-20131115/33613_1 /ASSEMBLY_ACC=CAM_ASM_000708 /TAXON_ID=236786 /ORGANISM="Florenciella sp., Strain RCC1007" /LENGTH=33 /DNA_ID= /DNA_START= /DNA_END= /DNA_ORIENTATION=
MKTHANPATSGPGRSPGMGEFTVDDNIRLMHTA